MEKSYQATAKRKRKSIEDGESVDAAFFRSGTLLLGTMLGLYLTAVGELKELLRMLQDALGGDVAAGLVVAQGLNALVRLAIVPLALGGALTSGGWLFLNGFRWSPHLVIIQGRRLSPAKWLATVQRSPRALLSRFYGLLALLAILGGVYLFSVPETFSAGSLIEPDGIATWAAVLQRLLSFLIALLLGGVLLSGTLGWVRYRRSLMMSREEVLRELKEEEGDPEMKHVRRSIHHQLAYAELRERIKGARVLVVSRTK